MTGMGLAVAAEEQVGDASKDLKSYPATSRVPHSLDLGDSYPRTPLPEQ